MGLVSQACRHESNSFVNENNLFPLHPSMTREHIVDTLAREEYRLRQYSIKFLTYISEIWIQTTTKRRTIAEKAALTARPALEALYENKKIWKCLEEKLKVGEKIWIQVAPCIMYTWKGDITVCANVCNKRDPDEVLIRHYGEKKWCEAVIVAEIPVLPKVPFPPGEDALHFWKEMRVGIRPVQEYTYHYLRKPIHVYDASHVYETECLSESDVMSLPFRCLHNKYTQGSMWTPHGHVFEAPCETTWGTLTKNVHITWNAFWWLICPELKLFYR